MLPKYLKDTSCVIMTTNAQLDTSIEENVELNANLTSELKRYAEDPKCVLATYDTTAHVSDKALGFFGIKPDSHTSGLVNEILKLLFEAKIITAPNVESYKKKDICTIILSRELSGGLLAKYNTINSILNEDLLQIVTDEEIENSDYTIMNNYLSNNKCEHLVIIGLTISTTKYGVKYREQGRTYDNTHIFTTDY